MGTKKTILIRIRAKLFPDTERGLVNLTLTGDIGGKYSREKRQLVYITIMSKGESRRGTGREIKAKKNRATYNRMFWRSMIAHTLKGYSR